MIGNINIYSVYRLNSCYKFIKKDKINHTLETKREDYSTSLKNVYVFISSYPIDNP